MVNKYENSGQDEQAPRPNIKGLIKDLEEYNRHFNFGAVMARSLMANFEEETAEGQKAKTEERQQQERFEALKKINAGTLDETGLSFEPVDSPFKIFGMSDFTDEEVSKRVQAFSEETGITREDLDDPESYEFKKAKQFMEGLHAEANASSKLTEMRLNVSDSKKFIAYLTFLKENNITTEEKESLVSVASILEKQFIGQYDVSDPNDDRFLVLIGGLGKIVTLYEELGLADSIQKLKELLEAARSKSLKELLLVEKKGYLRPHDVGFGPAKWHTDATPEFYEKSWDEAIRVYKETLENPRAMELSEKLRTHLIEAIEIARKDIASDKRKSDSYPKFLKTLDIVSAEL